MDKLLELIDERIAVAEAELAALKELKRNFMALMDVKVTAEPKAAPKAEVAVSDISTFFNASTRSANDATNKVREKILNMLDDIPESYLADAEYGPSWRTVHEEWKAAVKHIGKETSVPEYTATKNNTKGGRNSHYDVDVNYYNGTELVASRKIEFKHGGSKIEDLPQFLSLQAKFGLFEVTYDKYWYDTYLDKYIACDPSLTEAKPSWEVYQKCVTSTKYTVSPFFAQLKSRELEFQEEKNRVVNESISEYLSKYGKTIDIATFSEKVKATQSDKIYLMWSNGKFCVDNLPNSEISDMKYSSIVNGNVLELKSGKTSYRLLLRWRNHKGILNPAWQISMRREDP